jgi:transposase
MVIGLIGGFEHTEEAFFERLKHPCAEDGADGLKLTVTLLYEQRHERPGKPKRWRYYSSACPACALCPYAPYGSRPSSYLRS